MKIIPAYSGDWDAIQALLIAASLPTDDLGPGKLDKFLVCRADVTGHDVVGAIGLEQFGAIGLLRSLVVGTAERGSGVGADLVAALQVLAAELAINALFLLTIDADGFFERLGFEVVARADTPEIIRKTREYSELCPGDAIVMKKVLRDI